MFFPSLEYTVVHFHNPQWFTGRKQPKMGQHSGPLGRNSQKWALLCFCTKWAPTKSGMFFSHHILLPVQTSSMSSWWVGGWVGCVCVVGLVWGCVGVFSPLAIEHSKVCTLCDFGHLQFYVWISQKTTLSSYCHTIVMITAITVITVTYYSYYSYYSYLLQLLQL
jgi:hypothetical protein